MTSLSGDQKENPGRFKTDSESLSSGRVLRFCGTRRASWYGQWKTGLRWFPILTRGEKWAAGRNLANNFALPNVDNFQISHYNVSVRCKNRFAVLPVYSFLGRLPRGLVPRSYIPAQNAQEDINMTEVDFYVLICSLISLLGGGLVGFVFGQLKALIEEDR